MFLYFPTQTKNLFVRSFVFIILNISIVPSLLLYYCFVKESNSFFEIKLGIITRLVLKLINFACKKEAEQK